MPDVPTTNIYVEGNFALMAEGTSAVLHSNRIIRIEANRKLQLAGNGTRITVCGPILGAAPDTSANGIVTTYNPYWNTHAELAPAVNVTNKFGRLLVQKYNLTHGGAGVTIVDQVTSSVEGHAGSFDVWDGATLAVTSGTLRVVNSTWAANCGNVDVRGGLFDTSGIKYEYLNAFRVPGTTTVSRAGRIICNAYRMAEGSQITSPEMGLTRLVTNGVMQLSYFNMTYANQILNSRAQLDWDGGIAAPRGTSAISHFLGPNTTDKTLLQSWRDRVMVYVREGGAVVSNNCEIRIRQPLLCGVPEGKTDGGFTKWGTGMMAFVDNLQRQHHVPDLRVPRRHRARDEPVETHGNGRPCARLRHEHDRYAHHHRRACRGEGWRGAADRPRRGGAFGLPLLRVRARPLEAPPRGQRPGEVEPGLQVRDRVQPDLVRERVRVVEYPRRLVREADNVRRQGFADACFPEGHDGHLSVT